jgi:hypothetical protein
MTQENMARRGKQNGRYLHGGYVKELLTDEERKMYNEDMCAYLEDNPYLEDPFMLDMLHQYELMKIRLMRINSFLFDPHVPEKEKSGADKKADALRRTMNLYATRMGRTYVSRQRKKDKIRRKSPFELMQEEGGEDA